MAISINPLTYVISIPKSDLSLVSGTLYSHDTNAFRLELKSWEDSEEGIVHPKTHNHNTEVTIAGVTYARTLEVLAPYSIEYEDGQYSVRLEGSNNNIFDVNSGILVQNQVQIISTNSAGLITVVQGSGVTEQDKADIAGLVWDELVENHTISGSTADKLDDISIAPSSDQIANAVWDEDLSGHTTTGTSGGSILDLLLMSVRSLGLSQSNFRMFDQIYDDNNNLLSATIRIYPTKNDVTNNTNHIEEYSVVAIYEDARLIDYKVTIV